MVLKCKMHIDVIGVNGWIQNDHKFPTKINIQAYSNVARLKEWKGRME